MSLDPLAELVHGRQTDLRDEARRSVLARTARQARPAPGRFRRGAARLLATAARRLDQAAGVAPAPAAAAVTGCPD